jgi:hypothetical protein
VSIDTIDSLSLYWKVWIIRGVIRVVRCALYTLLIAHL